MINGINSSRKDNPSWGIINATETAKVPQNGIESILSGRNKVGSAWGIAMAWLIGLPRRTGRKLYAMNDLEAQWRGWQVTERWGGLVRQYRDPRFDLLRPAAEAQNLEAETHGDPESAP